MRNQRFRIENGGIGWMQRWCGWDRPLETRDRQHGGKGDPLSKDDVAAVQPRRRHRGDEELAPVGARPRVRHRQQPGARVLELEVLVGERAAVDGRPAGPVVICEVAPLYHEVRDDSVK